MNFNQIFKQLTKVSIAFIFTLIVIGSLTSLSNSIFVDKILDDLSANSINKINQVKSELADLKKSLDFNKKRIPHTVVGRKELQAKFVIPTAGYKIKEDADGVHLLITNITIQQKANITFYLQDKGLMEGMSEDFRRLQILVGIIK